MSAKKRLGREKEPFASTDAAHAVVRIAEELNWNLADPQAFLRQAQHVEYGLSAEIEVAAILRWLGRCRFVHRLNEEVLKDSAYDTLEVPDLLAVFGDGAERRAALIEVKTGDEINLVFKQPYLEKLNAYAGLLNLPLLVASAPRRILDAVRSSSRRAARRSPRADQLRSCGQERPHERAGGRFLSGSGSRGGPAI